MKQYTEEQLKQVIDLTFASWCLSKSFTPIELPSDEDIIKMDLGSGMHDFYKQGFIDGAKWMRDKLTNIKDK
jgi:hypothetical protein